MGSDPCAECIGNCFAGFCLGMGQSAGQALCEAGCNALTAKQKENLCVVTSIAVAIISSMIFIQQMYLYSMYGYCSIGNSGLIVTGSITLLTIVFSILALIENNNK